MDDRDQAWSGLLDAGLDGGETLVYYGAAGKRRRNGASKTERDVLYKLMVTHDDTERAKMRQMLWAERRRIKRELSQAHFGYVLRHRAGAERGMANCQHAPIHTQAVRSLDATQGV